MAASRYIVGIDLGTTNCAVAYADHRAARGGAVAVRAFETPQLTAPGELHPRPMLPSFLYLPGPHDLPPGSTRLPWDPDRSYVVGEFAREQGARVTGRLVSSAKSWLCHPGVDRTAAILPWAAAPGVAKVSPITASSRYLEHIREAWNASVAAGRAGDRLEEQDIVLTVPASFDEVARDLTVEAARRAGLERLTLIEEPQAAFYAWLDAHTGDWAEQVSVGQVILVCDVGGGTTDFSLILTDESDGRLSFRRLAVGEHLMLGGDNMDVALARRVETRVAGQPGRLDSVQWSGLVQRCRAAKELLLGEDPPERVSVSLPGRTSKVIGGRIDAELTRDEVLALVLDGFLPFTAPDDEPVRQARSGLQEFGLPYVSDPAIPKYLSTFLRQHRMPRPDPEAWPMTRPDLVLFNGGALTPPVVRDRIVETIASWFRALGGEPDWKPGVLVTGSLDLAVARGAAHYGVVRRTGGVRIAGGTARTYYVGIEAPGADAPRALCVVPRGMQEGEEVRIEDRSFELTLGQPVGFPIYTSTVRTGDRPGALVPVDDRFMEALAPVETTLRAGSRTAAVKTIPVQLLARYTELGTIELWCASRRDNRRWRLQFQVRSARPAAAASPGENQPYEPVERGGTRGGVPVRVPSHAAAALARRSNAAAAGAAGQVTLDESVVDMAAGLVRAAFQAAPEPLDPDAVTPDSVMKRLRDVIGLGRDAWPIALLRRAWEPLADAADLRRSSARHEARWSNLAGFCLRPGYGYPNDEFRVQQLWRIAQAGPVYPRDEPSRTQWWILWRRVAGGLNTGYQEQLWGRLAPTLLPGRAKGRKPTGPRPGAQELTEMWRVAASLDRISEDTKLQLADALLKELRRSPPPYVLWALARIGTRVPLYGPLNTVVSRAAAEIWIDRLLESVQPGENASLTNELAFALALLARKSGDRHRDIDERLRARVVHRLGQIGARQHLVRLVTEVAELDAAEQKIAFGEALPAGLRLVEEPGG